ncbi:major facilitator superfamily domain-containing protein, partial [Protomyces lactucae-debilis]
QQAPAVDTSIEAWTFILAASVLEFLAFGYSFAFGVLQDYYASPSEQDAKLPLFQNANPLAISAVGTIGSGLQYCLGIVFEPVYKAYPTTIKISMWTALVATAAAFVLSSFATRIWHLILLQGFLFGIASSALYFPVIVHLTDWFAQRRALASGIIFGGSSAGGILFPFLFRVMLERLGFKTAMRVYACGFFVIGGLTIPFIRPRIKHSEHNPGFRMPDFSFCKSWTFVLFAISVVGHRLAYGPVSILISSYTRTFTTTQGALPSTLALVLLNAAAMVSLVGFGWASDHFPFWHVMPIAGIGGCLSVALVLGFAQDFKAIYGFVICFGLTTGGYAAIWTAAAKYMAGNKHPAGFIFLSLSFVAGLATIVGPIVVGKL